jgi:hypothetical protein
VPPRGSPAIPCFTIDDAPVALTGSPPSPRNSEIYERYREGERVIDLAAEYSISPARVYQILVQVDEYLKRGGGIP